MRRIKVDEKSPIEVPGVGVVSMAYWKSLPAKDKSYAIFYHKAKQLGDTDIMSKEEWESLEPSAREKFLRAAMDDPRLMSVAKDLARAGGTKISIGEKAKIAKEVRSATKDIDAKTNVISAKFLADTEKKIRGDVSLDKYGLGTPEYEHAVKINVLKSLDSAIKNAYKDATITRTKEGWFANGKLVRRNPYGR
jgi:hypothetical protein